MYIYVFHLFSGTIYQMFANYLFFPLGRGMLNVQLNYEDTKG
jgi:hypothetical protein